MSEYFDIHSHILPGLDDDPLDLKTSKQMLYKAYDSGGEYYCNTTLS